MKEKEFVKLLKEIESFDRRVEALESLVGGSIRNDNDMVLFVDEVYESKEFLVATKNARFIFSEIDKNDNRKREYVTALDWLMASNLVLSCNLVVKPEYPLKGFINNDIFKLYLSNTGILNIVLNISKKNFFLDGTFPIRK